MKLRFRMWAADLGGNPRRTPAHSVETSFAFACTLALPTKRRPEDVPSSAQLHDSERIVRDLVALLHRGAPAEEFAARLGEVESLPEEEGREKSSLVELV